MNEETKSKDTRVVKLTPKEYSELERALQWPEDLPRYDRIAAPLNMSEVMIDKGADE